MNKTKTFKSALQYILTCTVLIFTQSISYAQIYHSNFEFDGTTRNYTVFLPQNYQPNMPLVISLHGWGTPLQYMDYTMMNDFADTAGFIVVYPVGYPVQGNLIWNSGFWGGSHYLSTSDDVGFISALIDTLDAYYKIDMARIYCSGFWNGGQMTFRLAAELTHRFAAVASVDGNLSNIADNWDPIRPIPILYVHGTEDNIIWYNGNNPGAPNLWSVVESLNFWIQNNNCSLTADTLLLPDVDPTDNSTVEKISWTNCSNNSSIIHYKIINGGMQWPGANEAIVFWPGGNLNNDINANVEIWNFFQNYENPLVNMAWANTAEVFPGYLDLEGDTLFVKAHINNPDNHLASVYAKSRGVKVSFSDSLQLYDDGNHFDENPNDNIWGNAKLLSGLEEDIYVTEIYTHDFSDSTIHRFRLLNYFTNIGPVVVDNFEITQVDTNIFKLEYDLRNDGSTSVANAITAEVFTSDTNITSITGTLDFRNINPGQVKGNPTRSSHTIYTQNSLSSIDFIVHIFSNGHFFWSDTLNYTVTEIAENETNQSIEYALKQNYPNPFNPTTTIVYNIPNDGFVTLQVYNFLGEFVALLVNEEKSAGTHSVDFDASAGGSSLSSGIYFYQLKVNEFTDIKKMILVK